MDTQLAGAPDFDNAQAFVMPQGKTGCYTKTVYSKPPLPSTASYIGIITSF